LRLGTTYSRKCRRESVRKGKLGAKSGADLHDNQVKEHTRATERTETKLRGGTCRRAQESHERQRQYPTGEAESQRGVQRERGENNAMTSSDGVRGVTKTSLGMSVKRASKGTRQENESLEGHPAQTKCDGRKRKRRAREVQRKRSQERGSCGFWGEADRCDEELKRGDCRGCGAL